MSMLFCPCSQGGVLITGDVVVSTVDLTCLKSVVPEEPTEDLTWKTSLFKVVISLVFVMF